MTTRVTDTPTPTTVVLSADPEANEGDAVQYRITLNHPVGAGDRLTVFLSNGLVVHLDEGEITATAAFATTASGDYNEPEILKVGITGLTAQEPLEEVKILRGGEGDFISTTLKDVMEMSVEDLSTMLVALKAQESLADTDVTDRHRESGVVSGENPLAETLDEILEDLAGAPLSVEVDAAAVEAVLGTFVFLPVANPGFGFTGTGTAAGGRTSESGSEGSDDNVGTDLELWSEEVYL
jgi:hypothetical protein